MGLLCQEWVSDVKKQEAWNQKGLVVLFCLEHTFFLDALGTKVHIITKYEIFQYITNI